MRHRLERPGNPSASRSVRAPAATATASSSILTACNTLGEGEILGRSGQQHERTRAIHHRRRGARAAVSADGNARVRGQRSATSVAIGLALLPLHGEPDWVRDEDSVPLSSDGREHQEEGVRGGEGGACPPGASRVLQRPPAASTAPATPVTWIPQKGAILHGSAPCMPKSLTAKCNILSYAATNSSRVTRSLSATNRSPHASCQFLFSSRCRATFARSANIRPRP